MTQVWIPVSDGERLSATLYLPDGVGPHAPVPCLLEALPYRKDDLTASYRPEYTRFRDEYGYAVARVDLRGTGSSSGVMPDEYHASEQGDLVEVIAWLAAQDWCTGSVGMFGTSWSGFNALQVACERPPALRAIVATYASDDRATDDVHYMGGSMRLLDQVDYPLYMVAMNALPPVPEVFGDGWLQEWERRFEQTPPWLVRWLEEPPHSAYWLHGSVRPGYGRITCPTMLIAGWADGYRNNSFRTVEALAAAGTPVHLLAGPWSHMSPASSVPGPTIDHVPQMARWWDHWLKGVDNGIDTQPPVRVFVRRYGEPGPVVPEWPGGWQSHDRASLAARGELVLPLGDRVAEYDGDLDVGVAAWNSCGASLPWGQPLDQAQDDARSLCVEWRLPADTVVLGHPLLRLRVRPDAPVVSVSAKLCLVDGVHSLLVDRGLLNLCHRNDSRDGTTVEPVPCVPGQWLDVEVELEACAFEVGEQTLRLALACADWPNTVAAPGRWSAVDLSASELVLPVGTTTAGPPPQFDPPPQCDPPPQLDAPPVVGDADADDPGEDEHHVEWTAGRDVLRATTWAAVDHGSTYAAGLDSRCVERYVGRVEIEDGEGGTVGVQRALATTRFEVSWPTAGVTATSEADLRLVVHADAMDLELDLTATLTGDGLAEPLTGKRSVTRRIPRGLG